MDDTRGDNRPKVEDLEELSEDNDFYCRYCGGTCPILHRYEIIDDMCQEYLSEHFLNTKRF